METHFSEIRCKDTHFFGNVQIRHHKKSSCAIFLVGNSHKTKAQGALTASCAFVFFPDLSIVDTVDDGSAAGISGISGITGISGISGIAAVIRGAAALAVQHVLIKQKKAALVIENSLFYC